MRALLTPALALALAGTLIPSAVAADQASAPGIAASAEAAVPIAVGATLPDTALTALDGSATTLVAALNGQPSVVVVFRGGWCPYCTRQLAGLGQVQDHIAAAGYQVVGISPDAVESLSSAQSKHQVPYRLFGDPTAATISGLGLAFRVDPETVTRYQGYGIELITPPGQTEPVLPVPAVLVVGGDGVVSAVWSDVDFRQRVPVDALLAALQP